GVLREAFVDLEQHPVALQRVTEVDMVGAERSLSGLGAEEDPILPEAVDEGAAERPEIAEELLPPARVAQHGLGEQQEAVDGIELGDELPTWIVHVDLGHEVVAERVLDAV